MFLLIYLAEGEDEHLYGLLALCQWIFLSQASAVCSPSKKVEHVRMKRGAKGHVFLCPDLSSLFFTSLSILLFSRHFISLCL